MIEIKETKQIEKIEKKGNIIKIKKELERRLRNEKKKK